MAPAQEAAARLLRILEQYPEISPSYRESLAREMLELPQLVNMNMDTLAASLVLLQRIGADFTPEAFLQNVDSIAARFGTQPKNVETELYRQRKRENILRYIGAIDQYRRQREERFSQIGQ